MGKTFTKIIKFVIFDVLYIDSNPYSYIVVFRISLWGVQLEQHENLTERRKKGKKFHSTPQHPYTRIQGIT